MNRYLLSPLPTLLPDFISLGSSGDYVSEQSADGWTLPQIEGCSVLKCRRDINCTDFGMFIDFNANEVCSITSPTEINL